ncbi:MAG: alpha/beta hydrolase [Candidatus Acidiferrales bacterium]
MMASRYLYGAHVHANGIRQHYLRYGGKGVPLILIPGITSPAITWGFVAERYALHFDTYILDVRGRGLSEAGPELDYGLDACAQDVVAFVSALGLSDYVLVGHSMGGRIAIRAARNPSPKIQKIVLVDPPVGGPGRRPYPIPFEWLMNSLRAARKGASLEEMRPFVPSWQDDAIRLRAEWLATCDVRAVEIAYRGFHEDDIHSDLSQLKLPILLVVAGKGGVIQPEDIAEFKTLLPSIEVERVENAAHLIPWDDFEGFFRAQSKFFNRKLAA